MPYTEIRNKKLLLKITFVMCIIFTMGFYLSYTFGSVFLSQYFDTKMISIIYFVAFASTIYISNKITERINKYHSYTIVSSILTINTFANLTLWLVDDKIINCISFIIFIITNMIMLFFMNLFLEEFSNLKTTGSTRSTFLVIFNLGVIISILAGKLLESTFGIHSLFLFSALINMPIFSLLHQYFKSVREPVFKEVNIFSSIKRLTINRDVKLIILSSLCLESFYVIMNIYFPIYILSSVGLSSWAYFGLLLPMAILPYLVLPNRLGRLAKEKYGEKEILIFSIIILILIFAVIPLINSAALWIWFVILLISRIGSSTMETMNNIYYYEKIHHDDVAAVNIFTNMRTFANILIMSIVAPLLFITNNNIVYIFYLYTLILLILLYKLRLLHDTR